MDQIDDLQFKPIHQGLGFQRRRKKSELPDPILKLVPEPQEKNPETEVAPFKLYMQKASWKERIHAYFLDMLMIALINSLFISTTAAFFFYFEGEYLSIHYLSSLKVEFSLLFLFIYIGYFGFLEGLGSQSLGKKMCQLEVGWSKTPPRFLSVLLRILLSPLLFFYASEKNYLHDWLTKSKVLKNAP